MNLWPDQGDEQSDSTVRTTIYSLRKVLGEESVVFRSGLYGLNLSAISDDGIWYDVEIFNEQYDQATKTLKEKDDKAADAAFTKSVDFYIGDYVQSFYNDWCIFRRDKRRQAYMDARHQLALIGWRRGDWETSLQHWQYLLTVDSCYEKAHYGIMRRYLQQRERELAFRQYQRRSQNLQKELQTTPGFSLQKLYQRVMRPA